MVTEDGRKADEKVRSARDLRKEIGQKVKDVETSFAG